MKIELTRIPQEGLNIYETRDPHDLDLDIQDIRYVCPIQISAKVAKDNDFLHINAGVSGRVRLVCSRCLAEFELSIARDFKFEV